MEQQPGRDPFEGDEAAAEDPQGGLPAHLDMAGVGGVPVGLSARQIRTSYVTAMAVPKPRDLRAVEKAFLAEAAQLGSQAYYAWSAGDKDKPIEGPSIGLALAAARCYGNCAVEPLEVQESPEAWYFRYAFIDLETGFTLVRPFRQSRAWRVFGKFDDERKEDIRFQIGASKSIRNVVVNALRGLIDRGVERAKQGERAKIEAYIKRHGMERAQLAILELLAQVGVSAERVLAKLERPTSAAVTVEDMVLLRGDHKAIQLGTELADTLFPPVAAPAEEGHNGRATGAGAQAKQQLRRRAQARQAATPQPEGNPSDDDPDWVALRTRATAAGVTLEEWQTLRQTDNLGAVRAAIATREGQAGDDEGEEA